MTYKVPDNDDEDIKADGLTEMSSCVSDQRKSNFTGVSWHKHGWRARLTVRGSKVVLGYFENEDDAARAWDAAARQHRGKHKSSAKYNNRWQRWLNFPTPAEEAAVNVQSEAAHVPRNRFSDDDDAGMYSERDDINLEDEQNSSSLNESNDPAVVDTGSSQVILQSAAENCHSESNFLKSQPHVDSGVTRVRQVNSATSDTHVGSTVAVASIAGDGDESCEAASAFLGEAVDAYSRGQGQHVILAHVQQVEKAITQPWGAMVERCAKALETSPHIVRTSYVVDVSIQLQLAAVGRAAASRMLSLNEKIEEGRGPLNSEECQYVLSTLTEALQAPCLEGKNGAKAALHALKHLATTNVVMDTTLEKQRKNLEIQGGAAETGAVIGAVEGSQTTLMEQVRSLSAQLHVAQLQLARQNRTISTLVEDIAAIKRVVDVSQDCSGATASDLGQEDSRTPAERH
eukprot:COSAG02_NODE_9727_length_2129_cov_3.018227_2_plen_458_part_00